MMLLVSLPCVCRSAVMAEKNPRTWIDLRGQWDFAMDPDGKFDQKFTDKIVLPGSMPQRLKGYKPTVRTRWTGSLYDSSFFFNPYMEKYRHDEDLKLPFFLTPVRQYVGDAWYRKTVDVPRSFEGKRLLIYLERPHITSTLYINNKEVGTQNSLSVAHLYDVTDYVQVGKKNEVLLRINNDISKVGVGQDSHSVTDQTQGNWNGVVGRMELQAIPMTHIAQVDVFPDQANKKVAVRLQIVRGDCRVTDCGLNIEFLQDDIDNTVLAKLIKEKVKLTADTTFLELKDFDLHSFRSWSEFTPATIEANITLLGKKKRVLDYATTRFGLRDIETRDKDIFVNGRNTLMRGTVENCCFPLTGYPPTDKAEWLEVFRQCKRYGLNHMRFHSFCPPEAAFEAADEVGFYLQPEGPSWPNHGVKLGNGQMIDKYLMEETQRMVKAYGNHPSFAMLSCGNEPAGNWVKWVSMFVDYWRATDNRRIYTGASVGGGWAWQPKNQYHVKAGARGLDWDKRQPGTMDDFRSKIDTVSQPFISHETGQWCAFPDLKERSLYTGVNKAYNFDIFADILRDNGMEKMAEKFLMASGKLQVLCYKYELEKTLRTPHYAGFQLLGLNDYSGQGTALVGPLNVFWKEKGYVNAKQWCEFCSPTTILARLPRFTYWSGEEIPCSIEVSDYGQNTGNLYRKYTVTLSDDKGKQLYHESFNINQPLQQGACNALGKVTPSVQVNEAQHVTLALALYDKGEVPIATNHYDLWLYPHHDETYSIDKMAGVKDFYICKEAPDAEAKKVLERGGKLLVLAGGKLTYGQGIVQTFTPVFWNTSWFKMRPPHTTGMYIEKNHPLFKNFPTEDFSNLQWWSLMNKQPVMLMDNFPKDFMPIVQPIDTWFLSRKLGMLFEAKVGKGKVLVTTMPLTKQDDPVVEQMLYAIMTYMNGSDFNPQQSLDYERVEELFTLKTPAVNMFTKESPDELKKGVK